MNACMSVSLHPVSTRHFQQQLQDIFRDGVGISLGQCHPVPTQKRSHEKEKEKEKTSTISTTRFTPTTRVFMEVKGARWTRKKTVEEWE